MWHAYDSSIGELIRNTGTVQLHANSSCLHFTMLMQKPDWFYYYSHYEVINKFLEGDNIMENLYNMVKIFLSTIANRKNYDSVLEKHRCLPTNQLEQDHNVTRIVVSWKLSKSLLRIKRGTLVYCQKCNIPNFLAEDEWKTVWNLNPSFVMHHN